jgi:hypothetical protein
VAFLTVGLLVGTLVWGICLIGQLIGCRVNPFGVRVHHNDHAESDCVRLLRGGDIALDYSGMVCAGGLSTIDGASHGVPRALKRLICSPLYGATERRALPSCSHVVHGSPETGQVPSLLGNPWCVAAVGTHSYAEYL